jgi:hypothetical protein
MSLDFSRAEYVEPQVIEGEIVGQPVSTRGAAAFPVALAAGAVAALVGSIGYAMIASLGFMVSIVAIGIAWLIAKAMMTISGGIGGRHYQIGAALLTYFAVSFGELFAIIHHLGTPLIALLSPRALWLGLTLPFMELQDGFNGILGLIILGIGIRTAWRLGAGSPGFGRGGQRVTPFG